MPERVTVVEKNMDLSPYVSFDVDYFRRRVEALNPGLRSFSLSCTAGEGVPAWIDWLGTQIRYVA